MQRQRLAVLSLAMIAGLLVGCVPPAAPAERPVPASPVETAVVPTPTPSASPDGDPVRAFDADCAQMLTSDQREGLLGPGNLTEAEQYAIWQRERGQLGELDPFGTVGGLACMWFAAEGADLPEGVTNIRALVLPAEAVPTEFAARYSVALCEPSYDVGLCRLGRIVGENWVMATAGWGVYEPTDLLAGVIDAVAENLPAATQPRPAVFGQDVWSIPDCVELGQAIGLEDVIGPYLHGYWEGSEQPEDVLLAAAGAERRCPLFSDGERIADDSEEFYILMPVIAPGAGWQWEQLRADAADSSIAVDVAGAADSFAIDWGSGSSRVLATDGTNVVSLPVDSDDDLDVAAEILGRMIGALSN